MKTALDTYLDDISRYPLLSKADEMRIAGILKSSKDDAEVTKAENLLIVSNLRLVAKMAISYHKKCIYDPGLTITDLISGGNIGLIKAVRKRIFDPSRGKFSTFVIPHIKKQIITTLLFSGKIIRNPPSEPCWVVDDDADIERLLVTDGTYLDSVESVCQKETFDYLLEKINSLSPREREIVTMVFIDGKNQKFIYEKLKLSRQYVGMVLHRALIRMKLAIERDMAKGVFERGNVGITISKNTP